MTSAKKPSAKDKIAVYEALFKTLHFHRHLTLNKNEVETILNNIDAWVDAHQRGVGETEKDVDDKVNSAFWKL